MRQGEAEAVRWRQWIEDIRDLAPSTLSKYTRLLNAWLSWCEKYDYDPLKVNIEHIEKWISRKNERDGRTRAARTKRLEGTVLGLWYGWMHQRGIINYNPTIDLRKPVIREDDPTCVDENDWITLWDSDLTPRHRVTLGFMYFVGLRMSELLWLPNEGVGEHELRVLRKGGVLKNVPWLTMVQIVGFKLPHLLVDPRDMLSAVEHVRRSGEKPCPWMTDTPFRVGINKVFDAAGIPRYPPHAFRRSACTNQLNAGVPLHDVSKHMNHKDPKVTMRYYAGTNQRLAEWFKQQLAA